MLASAVLLVLALTGAESGGPIEVKADGNRRLDLVFHFAEAGSDSALARLVPCPPTGLPAVVCDGGQVSFGSPVSAAGLRLVPLIVKPAGEREAVTVRLEYPTRLASTGRGAMGRLMARRSGIEASGRMPDCYLIIVPDDFADIIQPLAAWKARLGMTVVVKRLSETGSTREQIRAFIANAWHSWSPPPSYVLLVGAVNKIPAFTTGGTPSVTDHPYACVDGDDWLADLFVGRLPAANASELEVMVAKTVGYESSPTMSDPGWFRRALCVGTSYQEGGTPAVTAIITKRIIRERLLRRGFVQIDTVFYPPTSSGRGPVDSAVNRGVLYINGRGWGNYDGWGYPQFLTNDVYGLRNGWMLPVVTSIYCGTGNYARNPCFGEAWLRAGVPSNPKGAVAFWGSSWTGTSTRWNNCMDYGIYSAIFDRGEHICGAAMYEGKLAQLENFPLPDDSFDLRVYFHVYNLLGDPALKMWTREPSQLTVSYPTTFPVGTSSFPVTVSTAGGPVAGAQVCLYQPGGLQLVDYTDAGGRVRFALNSAGSDTILVTVTGADLLPHLGSAVPQQTAVFVGYQAHSPEVLGAGVAAELTVQLRNFGSGQTARSVRATLRSLVAGASVSDSIRDYGDIAAGAGAAAAPFVVNVAPSCTSGQRLQFEMLIRSADSSWTALFEVPVNAPTLVPVRGIVHDANGVLEPGETAEFSVLVRNNGREPAAVNSARLRAVATTALAVEDSVGTFGTILPGDSAVNSADRFRLRASSTVAVGRRFTLRLVLSGTDGFEQQLDFPITVGVVGSDAPTGPDRYGYWAYDNTDVRYSEHPQFDWLELDPACGGNGTRLVMGKDTAIPITLPFAFPFYGREYRTVSVSDNGYLAMGEAWYGEIYNWHIPSASGPDGLLAAWWDDFRADTLGAGVFWRYDEAAGRFVIQWSRCPHVHGYRPPSLAEPQTFQAILFDPARHPTRTGDGAMLVQWLDIVNDDSLPGNSHNFATVGIQHPDHTDGIEYTFAGRYGAGAAPAGAGRAVLFTTNPPDTFIAVKEGAGQLRPAALSLVSNPVRGRLVLRGTTGADGPFELTVYNVVGQAVWRRRLGAIRPEGVAVDLTGLPAGVYRLALTAGIDRSTIYTGQLVLVQ